MRGEHDAAGTFRADPDDVTSRSDHTANVRPRILIVDDHEAFRTLARALLEDDGFDVIGEAADGRTAITETAALCPRIVLLDVHLPDMDGFAVSERLAALPTPPVVVLISSRPLGELRNRVRDSPVAGFIPKDELSGSAVTALAG